MTWDVRGYWGFVAALAKEGEINASLTSVTRQGISAVLDRFSAQPIFQKNVNWSNVVAIGHSSGGQTAAMLADATFGLQRLTEYCASDAFKNNSAHRNEMHASRWWRCSIQR